MSTPLPQIPAVTTRPPLCRMLRTKTAFGSYGDLGADWQEGESTTAVYWCLGTMETAGPDDAYCHPTNCRPGRTCFVPELE